MPLVRPGVAALSSALLLVMLLPSAAGATGVSIVTTTRSGSALTVAGLASFTDEPFRMLGADTAGDSLPPGGEVVGRDVVGFSISTGVGKDLTLRWHLNPLMATDRGVDVSYASAFCVGPGDENCWVITFVDSAGTPLTNSFVWSWQCPDASCAITAGSHIHSWETDRYDPATKTALATVPFEDLGITPGAELRAVDPAYFGGPVFVTSPWWFVLTSSTYPTYDAAAIPWTHRLAVKEATLAIGPPGQSSEEVAYDTPATVDEFNRFSGTLDVSALPPGEYTVYARACFGENNCGYATRDVTL